MNHKNHLKIAHSLWLPQLKPHATFIDATAGNGHDSLFIAQNSLHLENTHLICIDIQQTSLDNTKKRLENHLPQSAFSKIDYIHSSHENLPLTPSPIALIVYNLGYLPGSSKTITTKAESSLNSLKCALDRLSPKGMVSLTIYPGHDEGQREYEALLPFLENLDENYFSLSNPFISAVSHSPKLYIIKKISIVEI